MPHQRSRRLRFPTLVLLLAAALLAGSGCDEKEDVPPEDQRLFLSAIPSQTCPAIVLEGNSYVLDESAEVSQFELVATVFADDGQVQEGVEVRIESEPAVGESFTGETDDSGQVRFTAVAPRRDVGGDFVDWTAFAANGEESETETTTGFFPFISMSPSGSTTIGCGEEFEVLVSVSLGCLVNAANVDFYLEGADADGTLAENVGYLGARRLGSLEFDEEMDGTNNAKSRIDDEVPGEGEIRPVLSTNGNFNVNYFRRDDDWGLTADAALYALTFRALEGDNCIAGTATLVFAENGSALVTPAEAIGGAAAVYDLWNPPNDAVERLGPGILFTLTGETPDP